MLSLHLGLLVFPFLILIPRIESGKPFPLPSGKTLRPLTPYRSSTQSPTSTTTSPSSVSNDTKSDRAESGSALVVERHYEGKRMYSQYEIKSSGWTEEEKRNLGWELQIAYEGNSFFDGWDWYSGTDPSHGLVQYQDWPFAFDQNLAFFTSDGIPGLQADHWSSLPVGSPRNSVRISSKGLFAGGLFIIDLALMPWGCGVWPAFWTLGYEGPWPATGEIDIVEGIQAMTTNHTTPGCTTNQTAGLFTGTVRGTNCDSSHGGSGCSILSTSQSSYGMPFNQAGGGVFAMQWDGGGIKMWNWNRANIPLDIASEAPKPATWGTPVAAWDASTCDMGRYFQAQVLILNIDLCGDWAGNSYAQYTYCPGTCAEYIANPLNLNNTVMLINYIKVFQQSGTDFSMSQADNVSNLTGAGGPVAGSTSSSISNGREVGSATWTIALIVGVVGASVSLV
ncbi:hypothetical protein IAR55_006449 [Kwoniella newhampshirensis]|uniref:GH16 domain-containing protein n=1 Tax=Kwoniella newhampshirensis TaxID=1651941 RepID=A0AAW0YT81_9TREE